MTLELALRSLVALVIVGSVATAAQGEQATAKAQQPGKFDGMWKGATSDQRDLWTYIENNEVKAITVFKVAVGCRGYVGLQPRLVFTPDPKSREPVEGNSFTFTGQDDTPCGKYTGTFKGKFDSAPTLSGAVQLKPPGDAAGQIMEITFKASTHELPGTIKK